MPKIPSSDEPLADSASESQVCPNLRTLLSLLQGIADPRQVSKVDYPIGEVLFIALCSMISFCDHFTEMEMFAEERKSWLSTYIPMVNGTPSHDVFRNVLSSIEPAVMQDILTAWIPSNEQTRQICIDGKSLRGSGSPTRHQSMVHLLRAWVSDHSLSIRYQPCSEKANEIDALPGLLEALDLNNAVVTIDAMGTHTAIAKQITEAGGDYVLALKGNQPNALKAVAEHFEPRTQANSLLDPHTHGVSIEQMKGFVAAGQILDPKLLNDQMTEAVATLAAFETLIQVQHTHGRYEERHFTLARGLDWWPKSWTWDGLKSVIEVVRKTHRGGAQKSEELSIETIYYISSMELSLEILAQAITKHWSVENTCHHTLDVTYGEDHCQVRDPRAAVNLSILRDISAFALRTHPKKGSVRSKRKLASLSDSFRSEVINDLVHA
jgi:predicted transposase YbfD/YdcC/DNA-binding protein Fis